MDDIFVHNDHPATKPVATKHDFVNKLMRFLSCPKLTISNTFDMFTLIANELIDWFHWYKDETEKPYYFILTIAFKTHEFMGIPQLKDQYIDLFNLMRKVRDLLRPIIVHEINPRVHLKASHHALYYLVLDQLVED